MAFRTSNPAMKPLTEPRTLAGMDTGRMTLQGTINKTGILLVLLTIAAGFVWNQQDPSNPGSLYVYMLGGLLGGLVLGLATAFKPTWAPYTAPAYAVVEGLFIGAFSSVLQAQVDEPIVITAAVLTFAVMFAMLALYTTGVIKVTERFKMGVMAATGAVMFFYMVNLFLSFFGWNFGFVHEGSALGIAFSVFVVGLAALNLVLDFALIDEAVNGQAPKYMEWYGAFALVVTLVWLYIEILRLLSKINRR